MLPKLYTPDEAAAYLHMSVPRLISILKERGYPYTELKAGARPWGVGRQEWAMTEGQILELLNGQARRHAREEEAVATAKAKRPYHRKPKAGTTTTAEGPAGPDGKRRGRW